MFTVEKYNKGYRLHWTGSKPLSWIIDGRNCMWFKSYTVAYNKASELNKVYK